MIKVAAKGLLGYFDQISHSLDDDPFNVNELSKIKNMRKKLVETHAVQCLEDTLKIDATESKKCIKPN